MNAGSRAALVGGALRRSAKRPGSSPWRETFPARRTCTCPPAGCTVAGCPWSYPVYAAYPHRVIDLRRNLRPVLGLREEAHPASHARGGGCIGMLAPPRELQEVDLEVGRERHAALCVRHREAVMEIRGATKRVLIQDPDRGDGSERVYPLARDELLLVEIRPVVEHALLQRGPVPALHLDLKGLAVGIGRLHVEHGVVVPEEVGQMGRVDDLHARDRHRAREDGVQEVEQQRRTLRHAEDRAEDEVHAGTDLVGVVGEGEHRGEVTRRGGRQAPARHARRLGSRTLAPGDTGVSR